MRDGSFLFGRLVASGRRGKVGRESQEIGLNRSAERGNDDQGIRGGKRLKEGRIGVGYRCTLCNSSLCRYGGQYEEREEGRGKSTNRSKFRI